jgi:hypothetical protein
MTILYYLGTRFQPNILCFFGYCYTYFINYDNIMYVLKQCLHKNNEQLDLLQCDCPTVISTPLPLNSRDGKGTYNGDTLQH